MTPTEMGLLVLSFVAGFGGGGPLLLAAAFTVLYGAGNGLATITRGTRPLALFDHREYGALAGRLLMAGFVVSAAALTAAAELARRYRRHTAS
ncbi:hypothetical protein [Nocardia sp. NPDC052566]|uniref:hypothetical protein n=1 Tax=Nocardia sp. NPDC052566 TaxID=3364330 RepID=UPI0037CA23BD